jgi:hypothetical protein
LGSIDASKRQIIEQSRTVDIETVFNNGDLIDEAIVAAVRQSVMRHKALNQSIVVVRDGKPHRLSAQEINLDDFSGPAAPNNS